MIPIRVSAGINDEPHEFLAWVDTAFNGSLVIPSKWAEKLQLPKESSVEAILADVTKVELEPFRLLHRMVRSQVGNTDRDKRKYIRFGRNDAYCGAQTRIRLRRTDRRVEEETDK